jgi:hypothetical protein
MRTSPPGRHATIGFRREVLAVLGVLAWANSGCFWGGRHGELSAADSILTERYVALQRARITAKDPVAAQQATLCEGLRISILVGEDRTSEVIQAALHRAFPPEQEKAVLARFDSQLAGKAYGVSNEECAAMARTGILGDTLWPIPTGSPQR